tara:strand:+ start:105 stop:230 length:126 start_codon:yes stop_codon:yes gene_type:complete
MNTPQSLPSMTDCLIEMIDEKFDAINNQIATFNALKGDGSE